MKSLVLPPDLELWVTQYLREMLKDVTNVQIDVRIPADYHGQYKLITIRNDGGSQDEFKKFTIDIAVNVYAADNTNTQECTALAARTYGHLTDTQSLLEHEASPVIAVNNDDSTLPHIVSETADYAHCYFTVSVSVIGEELH